MRKQSLVVLVVVAAFVLVTSFEIAESSTWLDQEGFLSAAAPMMLSMESFETLPADNVPYACSTISVPGFTIEVDGNLLGVYDQVGFAGMHAIDGLKYVVAAGDIDTTYQMDFYLAAPIKAFGINIGDWGDVGSGTLSFGDNIGDSYGIAAGSRPSGNHIFFGIISTQSFNRVTLYQTNEHDGWSIDEVYYGIPEPATFLLLSLGGAVLTRKHKTKNQSM